MDLVVITLPKDHS